MKSMKTKITKQWIVDYTNICCEFLQVGTDDLTLKISPNPGGNKTWIGALICYKDYQATLELSDKIKNIPKWRKIILHECLHYKMRKMDYTVKRDLPGIDRVTQSRIRTSYDVVMEEYIESMIDVLFSIVEMEYDEFKKTKN